MRKAHQDELAHARRARRREQVLHVADVRPRQEHLRPRREEEPREMHDAIDVPARLGQRRRILEVRGAHRDVRMRARVEGERRAVHQELQPVRAREQMAGEERGHVAGRPGDDNGQDASSSSRPLGS
jgi:hypothetical protein